MTELRTYLPESTAKRDTARAFDDACEASGLSDEQIGAYLGCADTYVGRMRRGEKPVPAHRLVQLPTSIARPFAAALSAAQERHHAPLTAGSVDAQGAALGHNWQRPINEASDKALTALAERLTRWELTPTGTEGYRKAEVTAGGVDTKALSAHRKFKRPLESPGKSERAGTGMATGDYTVVFS